MDASNELARIAWPHGFWISKRLRLERLGLILDDCRFGSLPSDIIFQSSTLRPSQQWLSWEIPLLATKDLAHFSREELKMVLCKAAYLVWILSTWTYLDEEDWPGFHPLDIIFPRNDTIHALFSSWLQNLDSDCHYRIYRISILSHLDHIQLEDGFYLLLLNSESKAWGLHLCSMSSMISNVNDEYEVACSPYRLLHSFDS